MIDLEKIRNLAEQLSIPVFEDDLGLTAVLTAEASNLAAKQIDPEWYDHKPWLVDAAMSFPSVLGGWGRDNTFSLYHLEAGVSSYHDPYGSIRSGGYWPFPWSRVRRQQFAFEIARNPAVRQFFAERTAPRSFPPCWTEEDGERLEAARA